MITVITGTPGAGKTLYTIEKLLLPLVGTHIPQEGADGVVTMHPRTIYTNINGLLLDHELIDGGDNQGLRDWHTWAKPGSVIVFDEVQRHWKPRANGSAVPADIEALETHRHMGVDFIIITQNVMLVDKNIHALGGRHLHVRRIANMPMAIVYEWDHVSRGLLYAKSMTKSPWRYSKKVFKLYKSADLHTKQPRRIPGLVWFILAGIAGVGFMAPTTYARLAERIAGGQAKPAQVAQAPQPGAKSPAALPAAFAASHPGQVTAPAAVAAAAAPAASAPVFAGCMATATACRCYDTGGNSLDREPEACKAITKPPAVVLAGGTIPDNEVPALPPPPKFVPPSEPGHGLLDLRRALRDQYPESHPRPVTF
ncbi:zona occludens toxin [Paracidovorax valerianellae]|uniref:Zona occludens toxin n=1 Tax=Paracidovorax valerianellae TaxID=187868 RepID=A0A1G6IRI4_9BURK|nr:zonular occludens toxin domain-containing protein [Paracidovorax valerianellae]SDC09094.1 zona occludens toxin [Paracidovorax valerianellae]